MKHIKKFNIFLNEGLVDKMEPKSNKELTIAKENLLEEVADVLIEYYPEHFNDYVDTIEWLSRYEKTIIDEYIDGKKIEEIALELVEGKW